MNIRRYAKLISIFTGASVSAQLEYRANFATSLLGAVLTASGAMFGLLILVGDGESIAGWSYHEAMVIVGIFTLIEGFIGAVLRPNLNKIAEAIRTGAMDFTLLKPIDAQFLVSARNINIFPLFNVGVGVLIIVWALARVPGVTLAGVLSGGLLVAAALVIVYAIWFLLTTTAFWFVKVENITELFNGLFRAGQFPVAVFPSWVRLLFTFIIPIAFVTTVPAEALVGRVRPESALGTGAVALLLVLASRWLWRWAVASYTSASS